jgi:rSAM/selenodomain-associated transferase 2
MISIIIPVLNEAGCIEECLAALQGLRPRGHEVIVVDGGSVDETVRRAAPLCDRLLHSACGRARQMNAGAAAAAGDWLVFLHADTRFLFDLDQVLRGPDATGVWGRFDVRLSGRRFIFRVIEWCINLKSRLTGIATGDQALFVTRELFNRVGGFPDLPLMEDVAMSRLLKRHAPPAGLRQRVITSSRRWEENGVFRTIVQMWSLRLRYYAGINPAGLAREYGAPRRAEHRPR